MMSLDAGLILLVLFSIKHMIVDGPIQSVHPYHYLYKGIYAHPGGIVHALLHGLGTAICMDLFPLLSPEWGIQALPMGARIGPWVLMSAVLFDFLIHYHVDWVKMACNKRFGWTPTTPHFWTAILIDQFAHALTYIGLVWLIAHKLPEAYVVWYAF